MAEDIDFKLPVRQACAAELEALCGDVRHGHARRVRCLQEHLEDETMGEECADAVRNDEERSSQDYRRDRDLLPVWPMPQTLAFPLDPEA